MTKAEQVCNLYYKDKCSKCPIRPLCVRPMARSLEDHYKQCLELEQAAEKVLQ